MTQRQVNQWVARLRERAGPGDLGRDRVLSACHRKMREIRGLALVRSAHEDFELNGEVDVAAAQFLIEDDALGRIYQALNAPALQSSYRATARERRKFSRDEISTVTQLFTPRWVVEFLLHNTLGRMWREWHPDSTIEFEWLIASSSEVCEKLRPASTIRVLDPACGTMNFGLVASEMLSSMYREEMDRAGRAGWPAEPSVCDERDIPKAILSLNLIGADIDPTALELARAALAMKFEMNGEASPRLFRGDSLFRSDLPDADVVVTNPPYLSARNLDPARVKQLKRRFPCAWRDEYACFIERCLELARPGGRIGLLSMHSFMFTAAYEKLRKKLGESVAVETIAHFGGSLFDVGNPGTLQTVAFTAHKEPRESKLCVAMRLVDGDAHAKRETLRAAMRDPGKRFQLTQVELHELPRAAWAYWTPRATRDVWRTMPTLGEIAPPKQGLATTDNARFVRYWWEVEGQSPTKWRPYAKGGQSRRWYQNPLHCVDWESDGSAIKRSIVERYPYLNGKWQWVAKNSDVYGHEGITYSYLTSGQFSARWMPAGSLFDVAGSALFPDDPLTILGILNSSGARQLLHAINPTVNFQVGDLAQLPVPREGDERLRECVRQAIATQKTLDAFDETTRDFLAPMPWQSAEALHRAQHESLRNAESEIDAIVARWYRMGPEVHAPLPVFDLIDLARRWIGFAIKQALRDAPVMEISTAIIDRIRQILFEHCRDGAKEIERCVGGLQDFLTREFGPWHNQIYRRRPTVFCIKSRSRVYLASHRATAARLGEIIDLPRNWDRFVDDGILINFAPLHEFMLDAQQRKYLRAANEDLQAGKYAWSETASKLGS